MILKNKKINRFSKIPLLTFPRFAGSGTILTSIFVVALFSITLFAEEPPEISTGPLGSPFFRHLAHDMNQDIRDLVRLEKNGFGRAETISLILISSATHKSVREVARRRLKEKIYLRDLANEAGLDYDQIYRESNEMKKQIEAKGDLNLPPPVFDVPTPSSSPEPRKKEKRSKKERKEEKLRQEKRSEDVITQQNSPKKLSELD